MTATDPAVSEAVALAHRLAVLLETDPDHPVVIAVRFALDVGDDRRARHRAVREAGLDVHSGLTPTEWRRWAANHVPHDEMTRRRAAPGPLSSPTPDRRSA
jgi:hypothetical protein